MTGPFETEQQARGLPAVQAVYEAFRTDPGAGRMAPHTHKMLISACVAASVELSAYDPGASCCGWAGWGSATCAVVAGLISRAHDAGLTLPG